MLQVRLRTAGEVVEGARLIARVGDITLRRSLTGVSYLSQSSRTAHLGLGPATGVDELEVVWPGGERQIFPDEDLPYRTP